MKILTNLLLLCILCTTAAGCNATEDGVILLGDSVAGSGNPGTDLRTLPIFDGVRLATIGVLTVKLGDMYQCEIQADDNLLRYFLTEVEDGVLTIKSENGISMRTRSKVRFTVTVPSLRSLRTSSSGDIIAPILSAEEFYLGSSSSGDIRIKGIKARKVELKSSSSGDLLIGGIKAAKLEVQLSSSGDCKVRNGEVERLEAQLSSSGDLDCKGLESREAIVRVSSSGDAHVWVTERLRAASSSSGDILYRGSPRVEARESSSGDIKPM
ncbi:MAG: DUF2807 domain-containing protein [Bacteroidetes bacterium]|nr:DUF2807 domain-containing protein [Bacteroidota bacterium]